MDQPWGIGVNEAPPQQDAGFDSGTGAALHDELLRNFHDAGVYDFAADLGIIQNGEIPCVHPRLDEGLANGAGAEARGPRAGPGAAAVALAAAAAAAGVGSPKEQKPNLVGRDHLALVTQQQDSVVAQAQAAVLSARRRVEEVAGETESPAGTGATSGGTASGSQATPGASGKKKRRVQRSAAGDKSGKGLRHFSMKVCEKVESKGRTTYNEVADELVTEFSNPENVASPGDQPYDEKNIRRRVYDALNVLMAMNIISKEKKEIQWKGLPSTTESDLDHLRADRLRVAGHIEKKQQYLQELVEQHTCLKNLLGRNRNAPHAGGRTSVQLPFILVQTHPEATVEVEISEDMQTVHFDFNQAPFEIFDDNYVLKKMGMHATGLPVLAAPGGPSLNSSASTAMPHLGVKQEAT